MLEDIGSLGKSLWKVLKADINVAASSEAPAEHVGQGHYGCLQVKGQSYRSIGSLRGNFPGAVLSRPKG